MQHNIVERDRYMEHLEGNNFFQLFYLFIIFSHTPNVIVGIAEERTCRLHKNQSLQLVLDGFIWHISVIMK